MNGIISTTDPAPFALLSLASYLVGSVNLTLVASRLLQLEDPRDSGSGNAGATNLLRQAGPKLAIPILLLDFLKAFGMILLASFILPTKALAAAMIFPLLLGNIFPVFHRFKGGKGVAAYVGAMLAIDTLVVLAAGLVFGVILLLGRRVSLASLMMIGSYPFLFLFYRHSLSLAFVAGSASLIIFHTHRANIGRLLRGEENPIFGTGKRE